MKNALKSYIQTAGLTQAHAARLAGVDEATISRHCQAKVIPASGALRYHLRFGIPITDLRPDLALGGAVDRVK